MWLLTAMGTTALCRNKMLTVSAKASSALERSTTKSLRAPQLAPVSHALAAVVLVVAPVGRAFSLPSRGSEAVPGSEPRNGP
jgi:hypothetical protein